MRHTIACGATVLAVASRNRLGDASMELPASSSASPDPPPTLSAQALDLETLRAEVATLRQVLDVMTESFWAVDRDWTLTAANAAAERVWGHRRDDLLGRRVWDVFPQEVGGHMHTAMLHAMRSGVSQTFSGLSPTSGRWLAGHADPTPHGLVIHFQDVTQQREAEAARRQSQERYRAILESIDEGFCLVEVRYDAGGQPVDYRFLETNPAFEAHTGLRHAVGHTARELVPDLDPLWWETYGHVASTGEPRRFVDKVQAMGDRWFDVYAFRLGGPESRVVGMLFTNITHRKHMEQLQQDFVAMASHDLAGPVTVLRARAQLMQRHQTYDADGITAIIEQTQRMERLINDLRELVRLETEHIELRRAPQRLEVLAQAAIERMRLQAPHHALRLRASDAPVDVCADADRVAQVFDNLLGNAVKYSSEGGMITVTVAAAGEMAHVSIMDEGPGIATEAIPHVFDRFYRADAREVAAGLGLGLYITRTLVAAHGGRIWVESQPGVGSTFHFTLSTGESCPAEEA